MWNNDSLQDWKVLDSKYLGLQNGDKWFNTSEFSF